MGIESFRLVVWEESSVGLTPNKFAEMPVEVAGFLGLQANAVNDTQFRFVFLAIEIDRCPEVEDRRDDLGRDVFRTSSCRETRCNWDRV